MRNGECVAQTRRTANGVRVSNEANVPSNNFKKLIRKTNVELFLNAATQLRFVGM